MSKIIINQDATFVSDASDIITTLNGLSDVTITSVSDAQILKYDSATSQWINGASTEVTAINDLSDVTITSPADGELLVYNASSGEWLNSSIASTITSIDDLGDVTIVAAADGDLLVYNGSSNEWQNVSGYATETYVDTAIANLVDTAPSTLDTLNELAAALGDDANFSTTVTNALATKLEDITNEPINDLSDVIITTPAIGNYLRYNGTNWTNQAGVTDLDSLTDVSLSGTVATGSMLFYGGSNWSDTEFLKIIPGGSPQVNTTVPLYYTSPFGTAGQIGFFNADTTPATGVFGSFNWRGYNSNGVLDPIETFGSIFVNVTDLAPSTAASRMEFSVMNNGTAETHFKIDPNNVYGTKQYLGLEHSSNNQEIYMENTSAHGNSKISAFTAYGRDSASNAEKYSAIETHVVDNTSGSEDASIVFNTVQNGTLTQSFRVGPTNRLSKPTFQNDYFQIEKGSDEPILYLVRTGTTSDGNRIGAVEFYNKNDADEFGRQVTLDAYAVDVTDGTEDAQLYINITANGASSDRMQIHPDRVAILGAPLKLPIYTVATLPSGEAGMVVSVSDSNHEPYYYDGSNWLNLYDIDGGTY